MFDHQRLDLWLVSRHHQAKRVSTTGQREFEGGGTFVVVVDEQSRADRIARDGDRGVLWSLAFVATSVLTPQAVVEALSFFDDVQIRCCFCTTTSSDWTCAHLFSLDPSEEIICLSCPASFGDKAFAFSS